MGAGGSVTMTLIRSPSPLISRKRRMCPACIGSKYPATVLKSDASRGIESTILLRVSKLEAHPTTIIDDFVLTGIPSENQSFIVFGSDVISHREPSLC